MSILKKPDQVSSVKRLCVACERPEGNGVQMETRKVQGESLLLCVNALACRSHWPEEDHHVRA